MNGSDKGVVVCYQRDQIGRFLKVFGNIFFAKVAQISVKLFGLFESITFKVKTVLSTFLATLRQIYSTIWSHCLLPAIIESRSNPENTSYHITDGWTELDSTKQENRLLLVFSKATQSNW